MTSVLIVDDEPAVRDIMSRWVTSLGLRSHTATSADEALVTLRAQQYDLAVIDVMMPGHDGLWLASEMQREHPHTAVVLATAYTELIDGEQPRRDVADLLVKPFQRDRFALAVDRGRQWHKQALDELRWQAQLALEMQDGVEEVCAQLRTRVADGLTEDAALHAIATERVPTAMAHAERVTRYAQSIAQELGIASEIGALLDVAGRFHDVGKAAMPMALLTKPSPLTPGELVIMQRHADVGAQILEATETLADAAPIVRASHEWFGGAGYPDRLAGDAIPIASRIIAVADGHDAMTHTRSYRRRLDSADAVTELIRCCPTQFDPVIVDAFLALLGRH
jgi:response regulator RpfG family c-di-GMP phosphodiesterase